VPFRYLCPIRWGDLDAQGHVNNAAFVDYLQEARVDFLLTGPAEMQHLLASGVLVVSHAVEYLRPVPFDRTPLAIDLSVHAVGASRFVIGYAMSHGDQIVGHARTVLAPFDLAGAGLRRLQQDERAWLAAHLDRNDPLRQVPKARVGAGAHRFGLRVRWSDLDSYGHVNNVKFFDYVQEARIQLLVQALGFSSDTLWLVVRQDLEYLRPLDFRLDPYEVATSVAAVGNRSLTLEVEIRDPGTSLVYATARTVVVGPAALTDGQRAALAPWLVTS
jgi:acyl-CoA thioester hydrolase